MGPPSTLLSLLNSVHSARATFGCWKTLAEEETTWDSRWDSSLLPISHVYLCCAIHPLFNGRETLRSTSWSATIYSIAILFTIWATIEGSSAYLKLIGTFFIKVDLTPTSRRPDIPSLWFFTRPGSNFSFYFDLHGLKPTRKAHRICNCPSPLRLPNCWLEAHFVKELPGPRFASPRPVSFSSMHCIKNSTFSCSTFSCDYTSRSVLWTTSFANPTTGLPSPPCH